VFFVLKLAYTLKLTHEEWVIFKKESLSGRRPLARVLARPQTRCAMPTAANAGRVDANGGWYYFCTTSAIGPTAHDTEPSNLNAQATEDRAFSACYSPLKML
jgi:hypothetical protein